MLVINKECTEGPVAAVVQMVVGGVELVDVVVEADSR
jgi:hypothetical protein